MGDSINDASAIKEADIGISVDIAVDIAKESADIILSVPVWIWQLYLQFILHDWQELYLHIWY